MHLIRVIRSIVREKIKDLKRSNRWRSVRDEYLRRHPECAACGKRKRLQVHHAKPFHLHPELELDPTNFVTLCMGADECHLDLGHGGSFASYNPSVFEDVREYRLSPASRLRLRIEARVKSSRLM